MLGMQAAVAAPASATAAPRSRGAVVAALADWVAARLPARTHSNDIAKFYREKRSSASRRRVFVAPRASSSRKGLRGRLPEASS